MCSKWSIQTHGRLFNCKKHATEDSVVEASKVNIDEVRGKPIRSNYVDSNAV